jgi:hypothetical protein
MPRTFVDSASAGRNVVDSLFSASAYLPGRFAAPDANRMSIPATSTTHFAIRPAGNVSKRDKRELLLGQKVGGFGTLPVRGLHCAPRVYEDQPLCG